tara:strand:+ start:84 stop:332 length:249 start_codon:yes stop_codon:yes gene_type:complete
MLIKLTEISFATSGYGSTKKVDQIIKTPIWLNPTHIAKLETQPAPADHPNITQITWGAGPMGGKREVLETPEQIIGLIKGLQ